MKMRWIAIVAAGLVLPAAPALPQSKSSPLASQLPLRQDACFGRVYDTRHLAAHPKQRVTAMHLFRDFTVDTNAEYPPEDRQSLLDPDGEDGRINLSAYVRLRDRKGVYSNAFSCTKSDKGDILCGIDCDGGSMRLKPAGKDIDLTNQGFVVIGGCGSTEDEQNNSVYVQPGSDDKTFRLTPLPLNACIAEREAQKPAFAALGQPLRVRLSITEPRCFARSYDAAHLAAHPRQQVKRISVVKPKEEPRKEDDDPSYKLTFKLERRDGKTFEKVAECGPDNYLYSCTSPADTDGSREFYLARAPGDDIVLRDPRKAMSAMFGATLGADDRSFKLTQSDESACRF